ncbi:MAG TPA: 2-C-methyl-D-erythritol 4-phosphate cytidylyltransferase [Candidatus Rubrimentiphilum sp.]|nr:2-C-methyl-D-erythritol 4-phosphate cytidylyltransferase [Candidatus Rubrimentiphilum sp.]
MRRPPSWTAIVVAAGRGTRFGRPKQLLEIAGTPMLAWSVRTFATMSEVDQIVVVSESEWLPEIAIVAGTAGEGKCAAVVPGGTTRQASVYEGLKAVPHGCDAVFIHDGARPLVNPDNVRNAMEVIGEGYGALLAIPVVDTVKVVEPHSRVVKETSPRELLWAAQTPQFATLDDMRLAHETAHRDHFAATDDAMLLERIGLTVQIVPGSPDNFKVTLPEDLARAEDILRRRFADAR